MNLSAYIALLIGAVILAIPCLVGGVVVAYLMLNFWSAKTIKVFGVLWLSAHVGALLGLRLLGVVDVFTSFVMMATFYAFDFGAAVWFTVAVISGGGR